MPYAQLPGSIGPLGGRSATRTMIVAVLAAAAIVGLFGLRVLPRQTNAAASHPLETTVVQQPTRKQDPPELSEDQKLHLSHADQQLVVAAEQLATARRVLATLVPALSRHYLELEKRRADIAWTACDGAQRAIEAARANIGELSTR